MATAENEARIQAALGRSHCVSERAKSALGSFPGAGEAKLANGLVITVKHTRGQARTVASLIDPCGHLEESLLFEGDGALAFLVRPKGDLGRFVKAIGELAQRPEVIDIDLNETEIRPLQRKGSSG